MLWKVQHKMGAENIITMNDQHLTLTKSKKGTVSAKMFPMIFCCLINQLLPGIVELDRTRIGWIHYEAQFRIVASVLGPECIRLSSYR